MTPEKKARRQALDYAAALPGMRMLRELIDVARVLGAEGLLAETSADCWEITPDGESYLTRRDETRPERRARIAADQGALCWFCGCAIRPRWITLHDRRTPHFRNLSLTRDGDGIERAACHQCCMQPERSAAFEIARKHGDSR